MPSPETDSASAGMLLVRIGRLQHRLVHARLEALGLYRGQHWVLHALWDHPGVSQRELADLLRVEPATVTIALQRMEKADLVERRTDPSDQRILRVYPTETALALKERLQADWRQFEDLLTAGFAPNELEQLSAYLARVVANLEALDAGEGPPPCLVALGKDIEAEMHPQSEDDEVVGV